MHDLKLSPSAVKAAGKFAAGSKYLSSPAPKGGVPRPIWRTASMPLQLVVCRKAMSNPDVLSSQDDRPMQNG